MDPPAKKIKLSPSQTQSTTDCSRTTTVLLDRTLGNIYLQEFYQETINRDVQEFVILQLMKDFYPYLGKRIMKTIPTVISYEKLCRERSIIIELIRDGILFEGFHGTFINVKAFLQKDEHVKKMLFSKHLFETMEQYKEFVMSAVYYDREGFIYDLIDESIRNNLEFSLRATLTCPKIMYKYPNHFLNLEFALEYTKREYPRTVMKTFLQDNHSSILQELKTVSESTLDRYQPSPFSSAKDFINSSLYKYSFYMEDPYPTQVHLSEEASHSSSPSIIKIANEIFCLATYLMSTCAPNPQIVEALRGERGCLSKLTAVRIEVLGSHLKNMNVRYLLDPQLVRELGLIFGYLYKKQ